MTFQNCPSEFKSCVPTIAVLAGVAKPFPLTPDDQIPRKVLEISLGVTCPQLQRGFYVSPSYTVENQEGTIGYYKNSMSTNPFLLTKEWIGGFYFE